MIKFAMLMLISAVMFAESIPDWVMPGILYVESESYYREDGSIAYVNKAVGKDGELGCFQMTYGAFNQIKRRGERFSRLKYDTVFAAECAWRYLHWLNDHYGHGNWSRVVEMYNAGPRKRNYLYLNRVIGATR